MKDWSKNMSKRKIPIEKVQEAFNNAKREKEYAEIKRKKILYQ